MRRATRQLEQKMKQDASSPTLLSSALSCPSQHSVVSTSSRDRTENTSSHVDLFLDSSTVPAHHHQPEETAEKEEPSSVEEGMGKGCKIRLREEEHGHTGFLESLSHLKQSHSTPSRSSSEMAVFKLEGVTEKETSTDCLSQDDLKEMLETLRQLGAFLCQMRSGSDKRLSHPWAGKEQKRGWSGQERAREVKARMRQAGLTPPSLIKRSASLAKLGSLDLSADDLSELELSPMSSSLSSSSSLPRTAKPRPHSFTDDTSKKKRVLPRRTPSLPPSCTSRLPSTGSHLDKRLENCQTGEVQHKVPMPLPSSNECWRRGTVPEPVPAPALISVATLQQYGRTHPLRRLKKRTSNSYYHTM